MSDKFLVAVYGSLRGGMGNHRVMEASNGVLLSTERLQGFSMYDYGAFPFISHDSAGEITIEVYEVTHMENLDRLEGYRGAGANNFYDREVVETSVGGAYIYFIDDAGRDSPWVEQGDWKEYYNEKFN